MRHGPRSRPTTPVAREHAGRIPRVLTVSIGPGSISRDELELRGGYDERVRARTALSWLMAYGPAVAWLAFAISRYGGSWPVVLLALFVGVGIFGLTGVFLAWFPWTVERLGFRGFGAWLRTWWDEDAR